jgi:hypothetical protein
MTHKHIVLLHLGIEVTEKASRSTLFQQTLPVTSALRGNPKPALMEQKACPPRGEVHSQDMMLSQVFVADCTKVPEANVVIIFRFIMPEHQV